MSATVRVVFDTNVVLSALLFRQGRLAPLRTLWQEERCLPLVSSATGDELVRVLGYPKFQLSAAEQRELLADVLPWCEVVRILRGRPKLPQCRDANDQMSLTVAAVGKAECLVSGDRDLLALAGRVAFRIVSPTEFLGEMG